ncbi:hypothetical protein ScPMuIL_001426 [Solemya velum]
MILTVSWRECLLLITQLSTLYASCLEKHDVSDVKFKRHFMHNGRNVPITLATSNRVLHNITNTILEILLDEVLGYSLDTIQYKQVNFMNTTSVLEKLAGCTLSNCTNQINKVPETMINLEVWSGSGLEKQHWIETKKIIDAGPLGLEGRFGWFMSTKAVEDLWRRNIVVDHWRSFFLMEVAEKFSQLDQLREIKHMTLLDGQPNKHLCDSEDCVNGVLYGPGCQENDSSPCALMVAGFPDMYLKIIKSQIAALNIPVNVAWIGDHLRKYVWQRTKAKLPVIFFSPEPSSLTANGNFTRVKFPSCQKRL